MNETELLDRAWEIAEKTHATQLYGDEAYINHVTRVFKRVEELSKNREIYRVACMVAILHDTVEDSEVILEQIEREFGFRVANAIWSITRMKKENYFEYIERVPENNIARFVKTCDLVENLSHAYLNLSLIHI